MPDIPKDPRQLARDILAGKISLEDLAREQARRRGNVSPAPPPVSRAPVARPAPATPAARMPAPVPMPSRPQSRPTPPRPQQQQRRPVAVPPVRRPAAQPPRGPNIVVNTPPAAPISQPAAAVLPARATTTLEQASRTTAKQDVATSFLASLRNRKTLRQGMILSEILGKPVALRDDHLR